MKVVMITGGSIDRLFLKSKLEMKDYDYCIAVDGGASSLLEVGVKPDVLIGDFDSINHAALNRYKSEGVFIETFPKEKDMTDTDLAIEYAIKQGADHIALYGGIGSRLDHTLGNFMILEKYVHLVDIEIINKNNRIRLIEGPAKYYLHENDYTYVSLMPLSDQVLNVTTKGLKYELDGYDLERKQSLGISNELVREEGAVIIDKGLLLVVLSRD